jgi:uncharacterized protein YrrD
LLSLVQPFLFHFNSSVEGQKMRKGSDLIGKAVVAYDTGRKFARVQDLLFDQNSNQLLGVLVEEGDWFSSARVLPFQSIKAVGLDAIVTMTESSVVRARQIPELNAILKQKNILKGTQILTVDGRNLGRMVDLYFDEFTSVVEGYEVSGGLFADAYSGRSFVPSPQTLTIGKDVAFVPAEVAELMEEQVGGLRAAMQTASEKMQVAAQTTGEKLQVAAQTTGEKLQSATAEAGYRLQEAGRKTSLAMTNAVIDPHEQKAFVVGKIAGADVVSAEGVLLLAQGQMITLADAELAESQGALDRLYRAAGGRLRDELARKADGVAAGYAVEQTRGRRVMQTVRTPEGLIVAAPGQIVTDRVIEQAKRYRREAELLQAVGLSTQTALQYRANTAARTTGDRFGTTTQTMGQTMGEQLSQSAARARTEAQTLWYQVKATVNDAQRRSARAVEEQRIKNALGRPVTRVILDEADQVILNVGDLITHQALEQARQANVLDIMLASVYSQSPEFSKAELSAPEPGMAALKGTN